MTDDLARWTGSRIGGIGDRHSEEFECFVGFGYSGRGWCGTHVLPDAPRTVSLRLDSGMLCRSEQELNPGHKRELLESRWGRRQREPMRRWASRAIDEGYRRTRFAEVVSRAATQMLARSARSDAR